MVGVSATLYDGHFPRLPIIHIYVLRKNCVRYFLYIMPRVIINSGVEYRIEILDISIYRNIEISEFRYIYIVSNVFCTPPPGIPVLFMRILNEGFDVSNIEIISISSFGYQYRTN